MSGSDCSAEDGGGSFTRRAALPSGSSDYSWKRSVDSDSVLTKLGSTLASLPRSFLSRSKNPTPRDQQSGADKKSAHYVPGGGGGGNLGTLVDIDAYCEEDAHYRGHADAGMGGPGPQYQPLISDRNRRSDEEHASSIMNPSTDDTIASGRSRMGRVQARLKSFYTGEATLLSCIINLANTTIGSGLLALPYAFSETGWILGCIILVLAAAASSFSLNLLTLCAALVHPASINAVASSHSHTSFVIFVDFSVIVQCVGACISYLVVIGGLLPPVLEGIGVDSGLWSHRQVWVIIGFATVAPLCFFEKIDTLKYTSALSLIFVSIVAAIIFLYSCGIEALNPCKADEPCGEDNGTYGPSSAFELIRVLGVFIFAFSCQQNIYPVVNELESPTRQRLDTVIRSSTLIALSCFLIVAFSGFVTYGKNVESNVLTNYPNAALTDIARLFSSLYVAFSFPVQFYPARLSLYNILEYIPCLRISESIADSFFLNFRRFVVTILLLSIIFCSAVAISDLGHVLSIFGATGSLVLGYIFPAVAFLSMYPSTTNTFFGRNNFAKNSTGASSASPISIAARNIPPWKRTGAWVLLTVGCVLCPLIIYAVMM